MGLRRRGPGWFARQRRQRHPHLSARAAVERIEVRNADKQPTLAPRIDEFTEARRVAIRNFQRTIADMQVFGMMIDKRATTGSEGFQVAREHPAFKDQYKRVLRAMDTDTSNEGVDWIPTGIGASLHERVRASGKVAPLFQRINLPTNPWKWPLEGADATAYRVAEPTSDTATKVGASTPGTGAATFDAEIFGGRVIFSKSLEADSALAMVPYVQRKLVQAFVDAEERAVLDGDTDGTHQDTDTNSAGATDAAWAWDGLRKRGLANASASGGSALTVALLAARRADMDHYGLNPAECVHRADLQLLRAGDRQQRHHRRQARPAGHHPQRPARIAVRHPDHRVRARPHQPERLRCARCDHHHEDLRPVREPHGVGVRSADPAGARGGRQHLP